MSNISLDLQPHFAGGFLPRGAGDPMARPPDWWYRRGNVSPDRVQVSVRGVDGQTKTEFLVCSHDQEATGSGDQSTAAKAGANNAK